MSEPHPLFPCFGEHSRMGHKVIVGHFDTFPGTTNAICRTPGLDADPATYRAATEEVIEVVPMDGPAFFGFRVLTEAAMLAKLVSAQPVDWKAQDAADRIKRIAMSSTDADEVDDDDDHECSTCDGDGQEGGCPDCGKTEF